MSESIEIIGAETHNLKNVSVSIPKNTLTVITGVSGSGKSSLAFDTLYAEGKKRYLESLSTYARMIISDVSEATRVQEIRGLSPTIAINQKTVSNNPRSTVGTITEIYDFYRLLFTTIGTPYCPNHPHIPLRKDTTQDVVEVVSKFGEGEKFHILIRLFLDESERTHAFIAKKVTDMGFVRYQIGEEVFSVADTPERDILPEQNIFLIIDRLVFKNEDNFLIRLSDSLRIAFEK
jgi:excinuclease ABC subunit A